MERIEDHGSAGGRQQVWQHTSETLHCDMKFGVYLPRAAADGKCPVLYFLSGLTCSEQNFIQKSGAQRFADEHGIIIVSPDTSPRGEAVGDDEDDALGQGAGFYVNATKEPWAKNFFMYDYVSQELPALVEQAFPVAGKAAISGHSMGGHGALTVALKNPGMFVSVSALAPIVAPTRVPWGRDAFSAYFGAEESTWKKWDACELLADAAERLPLFVDQGLDDPFLHNQLRPELLEEACKRADHPLTLRRHAGYDHSYYFVASFIADHIAYHAKALMV